MEIPDLLGFLDLARLHRARGELALESGDAAGIRSSLAGLGAMAGAFYRESTLITALVGLAVEREQLRLVASMLESGVTDPSPEIVARLLPSEPLPVVLQRSLSAEALMFRDASRAVRLGASEDLSLRQVLLAPFDGLIEDDGLDFFAATIAATAEPWAAWRVREETGELDPGFWARLSPLPPRADEIVEKVAGVAASRQLARLALRLAATVGDLADPERLSDAPASPYSGARPRIESGPDGRRVLVDPSAERLWSLSNPGKELRRRPIFRWVLPPESERGAPRSSVS